MNRYEGAGAQHRTAGEALAYHKGGAPWPTCSCQHCRAARRRTPETLLEIVKRIRGGIFEELRDRPGRGDLR